MVNKKIQLTGCVNYNYKGELFSNKNIYELKSARADELLSLEDDYGRPYFRIAKVTKVKPLVTEEVEENGVKIKTIHTHVAATDETPVKTSGDKSTLKDVEEIQNLDIEEDVEV